MAEYWYANGQARSNLGYVGFDGTNRFVVSYLFTVPASGASSVSVSLSGIASLHGSSGTLGLKIGTTANQYASAGASTTPDGTGYLSYSSYSYWNGTITASGLNLPAGQYYATIYVPSNDVFYWSNWVANADYITTSGSYTPTSSSISSITSSVATLGTVTIVMDNPGGLTHTASFYYGSTLLATSSSFTTTLAYTCPRAWFAQNISVTTMNITVIVTSSAGGTSTGYFDLTADSGMKPNVTASALTIEAVNDGTSLTGFIANISKVKVTFGSIDMSATASAQIRSYRVECQSIPYTGSSPITTAKITGSCTAICTVTDSRGRTGSYTVTITAKAYVLPTLTNYSAIRCTAAGTESQTGTSVKCLATAVYSSLDGANSATIKVYLKQGSGSYTQIGTLSSGTETRFDNVMSQSYTYTVKLEIVDTAGGSNYYEIPLAYEEWAMQFMPSGKGVAFGSAASTNYCLAVPSNWIIQAGSAVFANNYARLVQNKHYGSTLPSAGSEGQIFFVIT